jgi:UDP-N-acetylmuramoylalanine--D-glutamate ligase
MANKLGSLDHLSSWHSDWSKLSVVVVGLAKTGFSVADTLHELGAKVLVVADSASSEILDIIEVLGIPSVIGKLPEQQSAIDDFNPDLIVVSPGVAPTNALVQNANEKAIPIWGDLDLAWRLRDRFEVKQEWICVTGTN